MSAENTIELVIVDKGGSSGGGSSSGSGGGGNSPKQEAHPGIPMGRRIAPSADGGLQDDLNNQYETEQAKKLRDTVRIGTKIRKQKESEEAAKAKEAEQANKQSADAEKAQVAEQRGQMQAMGNMAQATGSGTASDKSASGMANTGLNAATAMGGEAAEMAAGPVGMAVAVAAKVIDAKVAEATEDIKSKRQIIEGLTQQTQALITNNHRQMFDNAVDHVSQSMEKIPIVGKMFAEQVQLMAAPVRAFSDLMNTAVERGRQLEKYNGNIAGANAQADVRTMQRDLQEAQRMGKDYARIAEAQSQIGDTLSELLMPIKEFLIGVLADLAEGAAYDLKLIKEGIKSLVDEFAGKGAFDRMTAGEKGDESLPIVKFYELLDTKIAAPGRGPAFDPVAVARMMPPIGGTKR